MASEENTNISNNSIFISQTELNKNQNISGKISLTNILDSIPEGSVETRRKGWRKDKQNEWRWRFLKLPERNLTVEISKLKYNKDTRLYLNNKGKWVKRDISPLYDIFVDREYYYYTKLD